MKLFFLKTWENIDFKHILKFIQIDVFPINGIKIIHSGFNRNKMKFIKFLNIENEMSFMPNLSAIVVIEKAKTNALLGVCCFIV